MKLALSFLFVMIPGITFAALCDDTYYLQSISETVYSGASPRAMTIVVMKTVAPNLANLTILNNSMNYTILSGFDGACTKSNKPLHYKVKAASKSTFTDSTSNDYQVQLYDTNTHVENFNLTYWFGFYKPVNSLNFFLGMEDINTKVFSNYYAAVVYKDSIRDPVGGIWSLARTTSYNLSGPADSAYLDKAMLDATGVRNLVVDENHKGFYSVQFLRVKYSNQVTSSLNAPKKGISAFQASQLGHTVLIQPGLDKSSNPVPLAIYGMMGNKVATLFPTGYAYNWNGNTSTGAEAPTGVYFVQAGNRVLGKFFYSRN